MMSDRLHEHGSAAPFKAPAERLSHIDNIQRIFLKGVTVSPLLAAPFFDVKLIAIDWLHTMDLGVAQIFLGSLFDLVMGYFDGDLTAKTNTLWKHIQAYYKRTKVENQLQNFKPTMLQGKNHPKLRSKAGETRSLIDFAVSISKQVLDAADPEARAATVAAQALQECYALLSRSRFRQQDMEDACNRFSAQYVALSAWSEQHGGRRWPLKPKFHLMQEMVYEATSSPADAWTYRDEGFGGVVAKWSLRRGGKYSPMSLGMSLFDRFSGQPLPDL